MSPSTFVIHLLTNSIRFQQNAVLPPRWNHSLDIVSIHPGSFHSPYLRCDLFKQLGKRFILGGDFNSKHVMSGSRLTTKKGRELYKAIAETQALVASSRKPTYWPTDPTKRLDLIDFFVPFLLFFYFFPFSFIISQMRCTFYSVQFKYSIDTRPRLNLVYCTKYALY